jgi:transcriptional regulator with XRE-family HTH domain
VASDLPNAFGQVLSEYRARKGWSQMTLAIEAGLHLNAISSLERGKSGPSLCTVFLLADALGVSPSKLIAAVEKRAPRL